MIILTLFIINDKLMRKTIDYQLDLITSTDTDQQFWFEAFGPNYDDDENIYLLWFDFNPYLIKGSKHYRPDLFDAGFICTEREPHRGEMPINVAEFIADYLL